MEDLDDETELGISRSQLLGMIDPFNQHPDLCSKTNTQLMKLMYHLCTGKFKYQFTDYIIPKHSRPNLETREFKSNHERREFKSNHEAKPSFNDEEYVRPPIPSRVDCLIPPDLSRSDFLDLSRFSSSIEDVRHYSEQDEAKRYNSMLELAKKEEEEYKEAIRLSLEQGRKIPACLLEEKPILAEEKSVLAEEKPIQMEGPNYSKLLECHKEFNPQIADKLYNLLKERKFEEFGEELKNTPLSIVSCLWKLRDSEGSTLKQLFSRKANPHKCME